MTPIEQAIEALEYSKSNASGCTCHTAYTTRQMTDPSCAACEYHEVMQGVDRALASLRSMEGREPVVLSDEDVDRAACSWAYTETGKPQDSDRSDWDQETKDWWHTEYGRALSLLQYVRDHGYLAPSPSEPRLTVEEVMEVVREELQKAYGILGSQHEDFLRKSMVRLTILQSMSLRP